jgi:hypothetical protein
MGYLGVGLSLLFGVLWAWAAATIAERKGYSPVLAGILGFLFGWIPVLIYYLMPDSSGSGSVKSGPQLGPRAQRQMEIEASIPPGGCRICRYVNTPGSARCYQCGNML